MAGAARAAPFEEAKTGWDALPGRAAGRAHRRLGVTWGPVSEHGQAELAGIPQQLLACFSTRTAEVEAAAEAKIAELERALGRPLKADERGGSIGLRCSTRRPKSHEPVAEVSLYERWATEARDAGWEPAAVVQAAIGAQRLGASLTPAHVVSDVVSELCVKRATFTRRDVVQAVTRRVDPAVGAQATLVRAHVEQLVDAVLAHSTVVCLQPTERVETPPSLVRRDGGSVSGAPQVARYTPTKCSWSKAGSCTLRRSAAPRMSAS